MSAIGERERSTWPFYNVAKTRTKNEKTAKKKSDKRKFVNAKETIAETIALYSDTEDAVQFEAGPSQVRIAQLNQNKDKLPKFFKRTIVVSKYRLFIFKKNTLFRGISVWPFATFFSCNFRFLSRNIRAHNVLSLVPAQLSNQYELLSLMEIQGNGDKEMVRTISLLGALADLSFIARNIKFNVNVCNGLRLHWCLHQTSSYRFGMRE
jgi:hypothetical protein